MPRPSTSERVKVWQNRMEGSSRQYKEWADRYAVAVLEDMYRGFHYDEYPENPYRRPYTINEFYASIKVRQPSFLFFRPRFKVDPRPARSDDEGSAIQLRARLQESTLNTLITLPQTAFEDETEQAILDAHFRFGIVQVGWTTDYIENPNAGKPFLKEDGRTPVTDSAGEEVIQPDQLPEEEKIFIKWVPAATFRVSSNDHYRLNRCDWCAYYEWHYLEDLKRNENLSNTSSLKRSGEMKNEYAEDTDDPDERARRNGMIRVWYVWDIRRGRHLIFAEGHDKFLKDEEYRVFPFPQPLKPDRDAKRTFYPIPPTFNWIDPQRELNDIRDKQRSHRLKFQRKYEVNEDMLSDPEEIDKFAEPVDGMTIRVKQLGQAIAPIADAPQDRTNLVYLQESRNDFREISGVSAEDRGIADAETATQANIISARSQIRESFMRVQVARWLADIGIVMLKTLKEYSSLGFWIKINVDPLSPSAVNEAMETAMGWRLITAEELGDINMDVTVAVESLSPIAQESERQAWNEVLAIVNNPPLALFLSQSETLLRKTLGFYGIENDKEIAEIQRAMEQSLLIGAQAAAQASGAGGAATDTPSVQQIQAQIAAQVPTQ